MNSKSEIVKFQQYINNTLNLYEKAMSYKPKRIMVSSLNGFMTETYLTTYGIILFQFNPNKTGAKALTTTALTNHEIASIINGLKKTLTAYGLGMGVLDIT